MFGKCKQYKCANSLFQLMVEEWLDPSIEAYKALNVLEEMKRIPLCKPNSFTYSILVKSCV